ncbi:MAG TPA: anthranilate phosphoribosyltransferase [Acidimicrobiales bacterium]|nr:anthranilate phosphoribosyltransferase [Acidimicrobiales bacterium]
MGLTDDTTFDALGRWPGVLGRLLAGGDLAGEEARAVFGEILRGDATPAQIAAFVTALRMKGETSDEMAGFVRAMLEHAEPLGVPGDLLDTCGTGGDRSSSINVSTIAAFVAAGAGARVCKHGGRAATSIAGSADVLEALGVVIDLGPEGVRRCIDEAGMGFCFAPRFHPAMRFAVPVRRELGVPTVFNFLGPLANPGRARFQVVGVSDPAMVDKMIGVLAMNGSRRAMVVHGADNLDELSTTGPTTVVELLDTDDAAGAAASLDSRLRRFTVDAADFGLPRVGLEDLRGSDAATNAVIVGEVLAGGKGPHRDIVVLNAAAGLTVAGLADDMAGGIERAAAAIDDGSALRVLQSLIHVSQECARPG